LRSRIEFGINQTKFYFIKEIRFVRLRSRIEFGINQTKFYCIKSSLIKKINPDRTTKPTGILDKHLQYVRKTTETNV